MGIKELLNHTSGVPDYFDESVMEEYEELWMDYPNYKIRHNSDLLPLFINKLITIFIVLIQRIIAQIYFL